MVDQKIKYDQPQIIEEFDLIVSAGSSRGIEGIDPILDDDLLGTGMLGLGDPFDFTQ
jgi:hypothetical protein